MERAYNFNAGPAALPLDVLKEAQAELLNFNGTGMSVMELSHRSKDYEAVHNQARELRKLPHSRKLRCAVHPGRGDSAVQHGAHEPDAA